MARVLLLLPTESYRAADFLAAAGSVGAEVVVGSNRFFAVGPSMPNDPVVVDFESPSEAADTIAAYAEHSPLDAVIPTDDQGVMVAARAAERLGLAHNSPAAAAATRDKAALRRVLEAAGIPQPRYRVAGATDDVAALAAEVGYPVVVKPPALSASRGVIRADDDESVVLAAKRARAISEESGAGSAGPQNERGAGSAGPQNESGAGSAGPQNERGTGAPLLLESYLPGAEVAVEGLLRDGALEILAIFDKPDPLEGPFFEETIYVTPSRLPQARLDSIAAVTQGAIEAIGLTHGPVHAELRVDEGKTWMLEIAARSIGGLCSRSLRFGLGVTLEELILRGALGRPLRKRGGQWAASGVMMLPVPKEGVLLEVRGREEALAVPGITGLEVTVARGRRVRPLPEGDRYLGFLFATGESAQEVEAALRRAHAILEIDIDTAPQ